MIDEKTMEKIKSGARVKIWEKISAEGGSASGGKESGKTKETPFEGIVIARKHGKEAGATFTVRATLQDVGVEKVYPIHSPNISRIKILSSPKKVHRSKLYYLRGLSPKKIREKLQN